VIIDGHCHAGPGGQRLSGPWDVSAALDRYLRRADRAGIGRTVLLPVFHTDYREANRVVGRMAARRPDRFWFFCMVHPVRDTGRVGSMVREAVETAGARGIKVHRHDAPISREICEVAAEWRLPILYDVMGDASMVDLLAREFPRVAFVIPHLGSFGDDWRAHLALIDLLVRHPNVYADTSGVRRFDYLVEAVARAGAAKLVFGTDGPWLHPGLELAKIRLLGLPPEAEARVTGGTIARLTAPRRPPPGAPALSRPDAPPSARTRAEAATRGA
jgi:predicted TIM-barrel fold metal-dependent hydrolase